MAAAKTPPMTERVKALKGLPAIRGNVGTITMTRANDKRPEADRGRKDRNGQPKPETRIKHLKPGESQASVDAWVKEREAEGWVLAE